MALSGLQGRRHLVRLWRGRGTFGLRAGTEPPIGAKEAIDAGANAFLRKERSVEELRQVFLEVASLVAVLGSPVL